MRCCLILCCVIAFGCCPDSQSRIATTSLDTYCWFDKDGILHGETKGTRLICGYDEKVTP